MGYRLEVEDRRSLDGLTQVVDDALSLADECGWRYALAYMISERVPSQVIQRLLSGQARARKTAINTNVAFPEKSCGWKGRDMDRMQGLFAALRTRRTVNHHASEHPPAASRHGARLVPED